MHCIDIDAAALEIARGRTRSAGHDHVTFEQTDVMGHAPVRPYDAVIGRHLLIHTVDALAVLKEAVGMVHVGGLIAFQEYDLSYYPRGYPELPQMSLVLELITEFFRRAVPRPNIGEALGMTTPGAVDIDTLTERARQEAVTKRGVVIGCPMIGAFARKPFDN